MELLLFIAVLLVVATALEATHRRTGRTWRPGLDTRNDRDRSRLVAELRAAGQRDPEPAAPAEPVHLAPPRSAATDARLATRAAA